jgi:hypothetical protein
MIPADRLQEIEQRARRYGAANCWTGDTGGLAAMILELLEERQLLRQLLAQQRRIIRDTRGGWCDTNKLTD